MRPFECESRMIKILERDLNAEIVIPEESHMEVKRKKRERYTYADVNPEDAYEETNVIDKYEERFPDIKRRALAKTHLQQIYDSSEWYSAKYSAGRNLGIDTAQRIPEWINELREELKSEVKVGTKDESFYAEGGPSTHICYQENIIDVMEPDVTRRIPAIDDAINLFKISNLDCSKSLLCETYKNNKSLDIRAKAGKALGYSNLRIWFHNLLH